MLFYLYLSSLVSNYSDRYRLCEHFCQKKHQFGKKNKNLKIKDKYLFFLTAALECFWKKQSINVSKIEFYTKLQSLTISKSPIFFFKKYVEFFSPNFFCSISKMVSHFSKSQKVLF